MKFLRAVQDRTKLNIINNDDGIGQKLVITAITKIASKYKV